MKLNDLPPRTAEMCSYALASIAYPWGGDAEKMKKEMVILMNSLGHGEIEALWGGIAPASALSPGDESGWNAALVLVARKLGTHDYVVVARGTNPLSWDSWKLEDFDVCEKTAWDPGAPSKGSISHATATALAIHLGLSDGGVPLLRFLQGIAADDPEATIEFAGHSLGGCMAPILALKFRESSSIDPSRLGVYAYAGPTPGDRAFAAYIKSALDGFGLVSFVRDSGDVVPHAWNEEDLGAVEALYPERPATETVLGLIEYVKSRVSANEYLHAYPGFIPILIEAALEEEIARAFGQGELNRMAGPSAALRTGAWLMRELPRSGAQEQVQSGFLDTLAWFLRAMSMHVLPYLALCLPDTQRTLFDKVLKPCYFKGHLAAPWL